MRCRRLFCMVETPVGFYRLSATAAGLTELHYMRTDAPTAAVFAPASCPCRKMLSDGTDGMSPSDEGALLQRAVREIEEYFAGKRQTFDLPLAPQGTSFQKDVWRALLAVPYGETRSYGELARLSGHPHAARAVGAACRANPLPVFIPCHRVLDACGRLRGYADGLPLKAKLLTLEGTKFTKL